MRKKEAREASGLTTMLCKTAGQNVHAAACGLSEQSLSLCMFEEGFIFSLIFTSNFSDNVLLQSFTQKSRLKSLESLRKSKSSRSIVVASDVAARGLDIPSVATVIHYDCARAVDTFIHRAGRTAVRRFLLLLSCVSFVIKLINQMAVTI